MATASSIEIERAKEAARHADILADIQQRLIRIENMLTAMNTIEVVMDVEDTMIELPRKPGRPKAA